VAVIKVLAGKRWIVWFGLMLVVASLVYLGVQLLTFREQIAAWKADYRSLVLLGISMFVYALANFAHFFSWQKILVGLSERTESLLIIFARSQLGKYLPGNVLHIAGRHILARDLGYNHGALLLSTLYEFAGLLTASGSVLAFSVYWYASLYLGSGHFIFIGVAAVFALPLVYALHYFKPVFVKKFFAGRESPQVLDVSACCIVCTFYLMFFVGGGISLVLVAMAVAPENFLSQPLFFFGAFALAWIIGFITPGAPSGIGVREAVLLYLLQPVVGGAEAALTATFLRLVTICGDLLFWLMAEKYAVLAARKISA